MAEPRRADKRPREQPGSEVQRLRSLSRDLVSMLALPAMWTGQEPDAIVEMLIDALVGMLRLDVAYARLTLAGEQPVEAAFAGAGQEVAKRAREVGAALGPLLAADTSTAPLAIESPLGGGRIRVLVAPLGPQGSTGGVAIGSDRGSFPTETESALFKIALNQAAIGLQGARLLQQAERVERLALDAANLGTWDYRPLTGELAWSDRCKELFGLPRDAEVDFDMFLGALHPEDQERTRQAIQRALSPESCGRYKAEIRAIGICDGVERWLFTEGRAFFDDATRAFRFVGVILDISERKRAEAERELLLESERAARGEAERASRLKDEFLAMLSHELRTPLNAVLGWTQLISRPACTPEQLHKGLATIARNGRVLTELISDLLDVSRIVSCKLLLKPVSVDLPAVIEAALEGVRAGAEAKGIALRTAIAPVDGVVMGDFDRLQQVVGNLLSNAVKFTPCGGRVDVTLTRGRDHAAITVADTGAGIDPAFLPHLFERFRQADSSTTRQHGGLGLGLSIVKHLVELHGARVRVESAGLGRGARFVVELPVEQARGGERAGPRVEPAPVWERPILAGKKVLVVDDEPDARELVRCILEASEAQVVTAASAPEALEALGRERPDLLVSDIGMPGQDGYSLLRKVRAGIVPEMRDVPALALTAFARPEERQRALEAGYQAHLAKPVDAPELVMAAARLASWHDDCEPPVAR